MSMLHPKRNVATVIASLALVPVVMGQDACSTLDEQPGTVHVKAPPGKCWSGAIGNSTKQGCGSRSFRIEGESIIVGNAQKDDDGRWVLTLELEIDGEIVDRASTDASYGIAMVSEG